MDEQNQQSQPQPQQPQSNQPCGESDAEKNKVMAIVGYIFPVIFFIPLINESSKKSPFAKFHANQQLVLLIFWIAAWVVVGILSAILAVTVVLLPLIPILWLVLWVAGIVLIVLGVINANKGVTKKLPVIGGIQIIK